MKASGDVELELNNSLPRHQLEVSDEFHAPAALPTEWESPGPIVYEAEWVSEPVSTLQKTYILPLPEIDSWSSNS
jgi:hypothetical protein